MGYIMKTKNKILIFFMHPLQLVGLEHETMTGQTYNWRIDIFSNLNIEQVKEQFNTLNK